MPFPDVPTAAHWTMMVVWARAIIALLAGGGMLFLSLLHRLSSLRLPRGAFPFVGRRNRLCAVPGEGGQPPVSLLRLLPGGQTGLGCTAFGGSLIAKRCMASISGSRLTTLVAGGVMVFLLRLLRCLCFLLLGRAFLPRGGVEGLCGVPR